MRGIVTIEGEIQMASGSLLIGDITEQIIESTLLASPGEIKEQPTRGVSIQRSLGGSIDPFLEGRIRTQLEAQGVAVSKVHVSNTGINIQVKDQ